MCQLKYQCNDSNTFCHGLFLVIALNLACWVKRFVPPGNHGLEYRHLTFFDVFDFCHLIVLCKRNKNILSSPAHVRWVLWTFVEDSRGGTLGRCKSFGFMGRALRTEFRDIPLVGFRYNCRLRNLQNRNPILQPSKVYCFLG